MLKVLIVDDDLVARMKIKTLIDWESNGFIISGEATNGENAISSIKSEPTDIVITDMNMPIMDGVGLVGYIYDNYPSIKVIALSGYDDFEYVRKSMKKGALDYILKHRLSGDILLSVLRSACDIIDKERQQHDRNKMIQEHLSAGKNALKRDFIHQILQGAIRDRDDIAKKIDSLQLKIGMSNIAVVIVEIDDYSFLMEKYTLHESEAFLQAFNDIVQKVLSECEKAEIEHLDNGRFILMISFPNTHSSLHTYQELTRIVERIQTNVKRYLNITASFSIGNICNDISNIAEFYNKAAALLQNKFFLGKGGIFRTYDPVKQNKKILTLDSTDEKSIIQALKTLEYPNIKSATDGFFNRLVEQHADIKSIHMICAELINIANRFARDNGIDIESIFSSNDMPYNKLQKYETIEDIKAWILSVYEKLIMLLPSVGIGSGYSVNIKKAVEYIQKNYMKSISLNDTADFIGVSSSYLSHSFKESCGIGFTEYLNNLRIEKAKRLIKNGNIKLKDIVNEVGFYNYNYFFRVFKEITGMTPLMFEKNCRHNT
jgi:Response regulator containing CheY-like receiver domain and AraC-type DNA-binding domain